MDAAAIGKAVEEGRRSLQASPAPGLVEDDVWDIQEYFERQFKGDQIVRALSMEGT